MHVIWDIMPEESIKNKNVMKLFKKIILYIHHHCHVFHMWPFLILPSAMASSTLISSPSATHFPHPCKSHPFLSLPSLLPHS